MYYTDGTPSTERHSYVSGVCFGVPLNDKEAFIGSVAVDIDFRRAGYCNKASGKNLGSAWRRKRDYVRLAIWTSSISEIWVQIRRKSQHISTKLNSTREEMDFQVLCRCTHYNDSEYEFPFPRNFHAWNVSYKLIV